MEEEGLRNMSSKLLEFAACDDLVGFRKAVEEEGCDIDDAGLWYGKRMGMKKMGLEERTPLMIAAMFGSVDVLRYILEKGCVDVNRMCGSDGATALGCAIAGGAASASQVIGLLIDASADVNLVGAYARNLGALVSRVAPVVNVSKDFNGAELVSDPFDQELIGGELEGEKLIGISVIEPFKDVLEKRDYPIDLSLPDIKNGIYGTDEFRMYTFKIKPCSRAYSHDWTECPFVHPGENARRRDPRKHHYSCVPCPEFRKGTCRQGDACEYAHGIFECWLHPAQYRTRLCKDETGCNRRVCFFAHKPEELRPLYASTGSAIPSPRSYSASGQLDMSSLSPLALGSPSVLIPSSSTPPMTPTGLSSPRSGSMWQNQSVAFATNSRLKSTLSGRNLEFDSADQLGTESQHRRQQQQQLMDEMYGLSSPSFWSQAYESNSSYAAGSPAARVGEFNRLMARKSSNLEDIFTSADHSVMSQLQRLSLDVNQSPSGIQMHQSVNHQQLRASNPSNLSSSPARSPSFGNSSSSAAAFLSSRSNAFAKRSQSFIDRSPTNLNSGYPSPVSSPSPLHGWGSPTGKLDWGVQGEELHKLRKSSSFGIRTNGRSPAPGDLEIPWPSQSPSPSPHMKGSGPMDRLDEESHAQYHLSSGKIPTWAEQMCLDHEQTVAH
uniref:C3H1-type domain-containing protein n=1 Tax=Kalanchoe fedtschenkoi TaxID=63787 RepID=A0A7N0U4W6_KALFE